MLNRSVPCRVTVKRICCEILFPPRLLLNCLTLKCHGVFPMLRGNLFKCYSNDRMS